MSAEYLNSFEVTGPSEDVSAFVGKADLRAGEFFRSLLPSESAPDDGTEIRELHDVEAPVTFPGDGYDGASFSVVSRDAAPIDVVRRVADAHPSLTFRLATVDLNDEVATVVVLRGSDRWDLDLDDVDWEALADRLQETGDASEGELIDRLFAESESVADDYRNADAPRASA